MHQLVLLRHGQSIWNSENRFTGWTDIDLSDRGKAEAQTAGRALKEQGLAFDLVFTSVLKRAIRTAWLVLDAMDLIWIPVERDWRLNGALQGLNKVATVRKFGEAQVDLWRRSYAVRPPALDEQDPRHPRHDPRYARLRQTQLPATESLKEVEKRLLPSWHEAIEPAIRAGQRVLIVAHHNSLRALIKHLDKISDTDIADLNVPTATPLIYELADASLRPLSSLLPGPRRNLRSKPPASRRVTHQCRGIVKNRRR